MSTLKKFILALRGVGLKTTLRTSRSTLYRDWLERRHASPPSRQQPESLGSILSARSIPSGACFAFECLGLEVQFLASDLVRISWAPGCPPIPYALAQTGWTEIEARLHQNSDGWLLSSTELQILIQPDGSLCFTDSSGRTLRSELPPRRQGSSAGPCAWIHQARLSPEEYLLGLGEQTGRLNLRGGTYQMWSTDPGGSYGPGKQPLYMPVPVYLGLHHQGSYLVFYENASPASFTFSATAPSLSHQDPRADLAEARFEDGQLRYYFIPGPPERALERYTSLTGRPDLPPLWSLGYHQSRWGYKTEQDIREVAKGFREHGMSISAIHLDIDYMDGYRVFTVNSQRFPDLKGLSAELENQGIHLVTILDPGVKQDPDYFLYREGIEKRLFCTLPGGKPFLGLVWPGWSAFPDFTNPETRTWWSSHYPRLLDAGIAGIWHDMNEPTSFTAWGSMTLPLCIRHHLEGQGGDHRQAHNLYALLMNRAGYEALRTHRPQRRPWIISRSGWAGQQRYAWNWTGDSESSWPALRMTIPTVLGMGVSGLPFVGPDIGGFSGSPSAELYLRSFQMAAFLPLFRTHSAVGTARREPWVYGEPYTTILRQFLKLRYRLLPFFYTLAWESSQTGHPMVRPLFWSHPTDTSLWGVEDEFLLGDTLLVAPILEQEAKIRQVTLPAGDWYSFWDDAFFQGPAQVDLQACLEEIPLFVRAGCILPMQKGDRLTLHIYPPPASRRDVPPGRLNNGRLYSDAGDGYGESRIDTFHLSWKGDHLELARESEGSYPFPYPEVDIHLHGLQPRRLYVDERETPIQGNPLSVPAFKLIRFET